MVELAENRVIHSAQLPNAMQARAEKLQKASGMSMIGTQYAKKEDRLKEAANVMLKSGRFRDFCEIQCQLGNWKKAMAFAPAVSIEYWQELSERHTEELRAAGNDKAPVAALISNQCNLAVQLFMKSEDFEDGKVLRAL